MTTNIKPRIKAPALARAGETITIKTRVNHAMESGNRRGKSGDLIPKSIINRFTADFNGEPVVDVSLEPNIASNPYFEFDVVLAESGTMEFKWYHDDGSVQHASKGITIR